MAYEYQLNRIADEIRASRCSAMDIADGAAHGHNLLMELSESGEMARVWEENFDRAVEQRRHVFGADHAAKEAAFQAERITSMKAKVRSQTLRLVRVLDAAVEKAECDPDADPYDTAEMRGNLSAALSALGVEK